jgi:hypothetical protein
MQPGYRAAKGLIGAPDGSVDKEGKPMMLDAKDAIDEQQTLVGKAIAKDAAANPVGPVSKYDAQAAQYKAASVASGNAGTPAAKVFASQAGKLEAKANIDKTVNQPMLAGIDKAEQEHLAKMAALKAGKAPVAPGPLAPRMAPKPAAPQMAAATPYRGNNRLIF